MSKLLSMNVITFLIVLISSASPQTTRSNSFATSDSSVTEVSPNGRYAVRFSNAQSDDKGAGKLWGTIIVRDLKTGRERTARTANGDRGKGIVESFSEYHDSKRRHSKSTLAKTDSQSGKIFPGTFLGNCRSRPTANYVVTQEIIQAFHFR
jgi:hypothetical protein